MLSRVTHTKLPQKKKNKPKQQKQQHKQPPEKTEKTVFMVKVFLNTFQFNLAYAIIELK